MLEEIIDELKSGTGIEDILEKHDWKKFETLISEIFAENGFHIEQNFRFKTKKRYEIDVIATKNDKIFCIDCKWWNKGRYKKSGLKLALTNQETRVEELQKFLKANLIARSSMKISGNYSVHPLVVTLHEEDLIEEGNTFIVPVWKLNRFINDL